MKKFVAVILSVILFIGSTVAVGAESDELRFGSDGKFTILQITDPQDDQYPADELLVFLRKAVETSNPDLIVITGDLVEDSRIGDIGIDGQNFKEGVEVEGDYEKTLENVKVAVDAIFSILEEYEIPYVMCQGNNDYACGIKNEDWLKIYASYPHCITVDQSDDEDEKIDMYIPVKSSTSEETAYGIFALDNGRGFKDGQAEWFNELDTGDVPTVVFEHKPVEEVGNLYEECHIWDDGATVDGTTVLRLNHDIATGKAITAKEPGQSSSQFADWKDKNVQGAFFGHIHCDGYTGVWDGITLGVTYGCEFAKMGSYGMRTVTLDEKDGSLETDIYVWEDGEFSVQQDEEYETHSGFICAVLAGIKHVFKFLYRGIRTLF